MEKENFDEKWEKMEQRCEALEEISKIWKKECTELRKFAELERDAFQSVIDDMSETMTAKNERIHQLECQIIAIDQQKNLLPQNDQNPQELEQQYQLLVDEKKQEKSSSLASTTQQLSDQNQNSILQMKKQIQSLKSQLQASNILTKKLQGENQLLKDLEAFNQKSLPASLSTMRSVLLIDEALSDAPRVFRAF